MISATRCVSVVVVVFIVVAAGHSCVCSFGASLCPASANVLHTRNLCAKSKRAIKILSTTFVKSKTTSVK